MSLFKKEKPLFDEKTLTLYNNLSIVCGIFSILLVPTGVFGIIVGFLGICLSVTYYTEKKKVKAGYILCICGSLLSAVMLALQIILIAGIK